jgi:hypothetical protein
MEPFLPDSCWFLTLFILHPIELQRTKRHYVKEDGNLHNDRCENLTPSPYFLNENNNP